jgi:hypothetical protein
MNVYSFPEVAEYTLHDLLLTKEERVRAFRNGIVRFEKALSSVDGALIGHEMDESACPLKHIFVDGAYVREIFMPKGMLITSKIHKILHPYFVMKGKCSVLTEDGPVLIHAPFYGVTKPGTKRLLFIHEDTTWVTVHVTRETDLEAIEEQIIASTFEDVPCIEENKGGTICHGELLEPPQ